MATSFPAAALGAEGLAADVTMLIGNGYVPGHAAFALDLVRAEPGVRALFEPRRLAARLSAHDGHDHVLLPRRPRLQPGRPARHRAARRRRA